MCLLQTAYYSCRRHRRISGPAVVLGSSPIIYDRCVIAAVEAYLALLAAQQARDVEKVWTNLHQVP